MTCNNTFLELTSQLQGGFVMSKIVDYKVNLGSLVLYETLLALEGSFEGGLPLCC